ncbi:biosynthetic peptidoglycan transglycosylase [Corallococcus terminator]
MLLTGAALLLHLLWPLVLVSRVESTLPRLSARLGKEVTVVQVEPVAWGGVRLLGLRIDSGVEGAPPLLEVPVAELTIAPWEVLLGWVRPLSIEVDIPRFQVRGRSLEHEPPVELAGRLQGSLRLQARGARRPFDATFSLAELSVSHPKLAAEAVQVRALGLSARGAISWPLKSLELEALELELGHLRARLSGRVDGLERAEALWLEARLELLRAPCQLLLESLPREALPALQGFKLAGELAGWMELTVRPYSPETLTLNMDVPGEGCTVLEAPPRASAERLRQPFEQVIAEVPSRTLVLGPASGSFVPLDDVSPWAVNAVLVAEDRWFFRHRGMVLFSVQQALVRNLVAGEFKLGASTISMQLARNLLLDRKKNLLRKFQELVLAWHLEKSLSKERILELYLNVVELGPGLYGIGPAAGYYFGKPASSLEPLEGAFLAHLLPAPKPRHARACEPWDEQRLAPLERIVADVLSTDRGFTHKYKQERLLVESWGGATRQPPRFGQGRACRSGAGPSPGAASGPP